MLVTSPTLGYSSVVRMDLYFNGRKFPIAQLGGDTITFREPFGEGSGEGEVVLTIDGVPRRWHVTIGKQALPSKTIRAEFRDAE